MISRSESVLITGGADGLGKALTLAYLEAGARQISILDIDHAKGQELEREHPQIQFRPIDLSDFEDGSPINGEFDTVICNAGVSACGNFKDTSWERELKVFEVNLFGHMRLVKSLLRREQITAGGRLAFTVSASVFTPFPLAVAYAASKAGIDGFANALEPYLIPQKISVSRIYPGTMKTAHQHKYYSAMNPSTGTDPNIIARRVLRGIEKRKRRIYPDRMGSAFRMVSKLIPWAMPGLAYRATRKYSDILYPDNTADPEK